MDGYEADGEKHARFAREALFVMSASCEHPTLTPGCPFAVEVRPGVRDCREECHDILMSQGLPLPTYDDAPARPVARRPFSISAPFDASALYLKDQERRPSRWSLPALLWALKQHLAGVPVDVIGRTRQEEVELCLAELPRRGFDVDAVVRLGMGDDIMEAIVIGTALTRLAGKSGRGPISESSQGLRAALAPDVPDGWQVLLDEVLVQDEAADTPQLPFAGQVHPSNRQAAQEMARVFSGSFAAASPSSC